VSKRNRSITSIEELGGTALRQLAVLYEVVEYFCIRSLHLDYN